MKVFWNELKLKFKEQLRVTGKFDLNAPNDYLVKRRKFKDIDVNKDFERRLNEKKVEKINERIENQNIDVNQMSLTQLEEYREKIVNREESDNKSDLYQKIILKDVQKMCVLATIKTHEFFDKFFEDTKLHPEMRKNLEIIEHHVKYNLPIEKRILFEAVPELFAYELGRLTDDERKRFRRRRYELSSSDGVLSTGEQYQMAILNKTYEKDKINEMTLYLHFQEKEFLFRYQIFLSQALEWGWEDVPQYLYSLTKKNQDSLTTIEKVMLEELIEFEQIREEIITLQLALRHREPDFILPFPMDEKYKQEFLAGLEYIKRFKTLNIYDTALIPHELPEESFMDRLRAIPGVDIDEEIKKSNDKYLHTINSGLPVKGRDMNAKDPELVRQIQIVSQAVKVEPFTNSKPLKYELPLDYLEEGMLGQTPTDGRILIEEYYKVLYLNNEDPEKYNFSYWENYFNVKKTTLRNIFNYIFFPIPDEKNPTEVGKILYFQDVEFTKKRKMIAEMTSDEYKEYLEKTEERPELQEVNRLEYLVFQTTATEPRITERTVPIDDEEIDKKIDHPFIYSDIIKEVDDRIQQVVMGQLENSTNDILLEKDIQESMEEIKLKRLQHDNKLTKQIEQNKSAANKEEVEKVINMNKEIKLIKDSPPQVEVVEEKDRSINVESNKNSS